jgi:hypothetical protein
LNFIKHEGLAAIVLNFIKHEGLAKIIFVYTSHVFVSKKESKTTLPQEMRLLCGKRLSFPIDDDGRVEGLVEGYQLHILLTQAGTVHVTFTQAKETSFALDVVSKLLELEPDLAVPEWADFIVADVGFDLEMTVGEFYTLQTADTELRLAVVNDWEVVDRPEGPSIKVEHLILNPEAVTEQVLDQDLGDLARVVCAKLNVPAPADALPLPNWDFSNLPLIWLDFKEEEQPKSPPFTPPSPQQSPPSPVEPMPAFCLSAKRARDE